MKKIVFGGFCMVTGVMLLWLSVTEGLYEGLYINVDLTGLGQFFSCVLLFGGLVLGILGLRDGK